MNINKGGFTMKTEKTGNVERENFHSDHEDRIDNVFLEWEKFYEERKDQDIFKILGEFIGADDRN